MIEHIARYPRLRDRAIFVGNRRRHRARRLRPRPAAHPRLDRGALRLRRLRHRASTRPTSATASALRAELGYRPDEQVCIVTVGGSGVGGAPAAPGDRRLPRGQAARARAADDRRRRPAHRPASLPQHDGLEVRAYVHHLYRHLAACDLAVVQGGLTTTMELTANRRPFLYFPLRHHFEQNFHVRHRLDRYGAGRCMDFDESHARGHRRGHRRGDRPRRRLPAGRDRRRRPRRRPDRRAALSPGHLSRAPVDVRRSLGHNGRRHEVT